MEVYAQLFSFIITVGIGLILGAIFDFYRVTRGVFRPKKLMTIIFDGVYWLIAVVITFACLIYSNWAQMRFYIFFGIIGGAVFYYKFISTYMLMFFLKFFHLAAAVNSQIRRCIMNYMIRPMGYFLGILSFPFRYGKNKVGGIGRQIKAKLVFHKDVTKK